MAKYVLLSGKHSVLEGGVTVRYGKGDVIELTDSQAIAFADKVKLYESVLLEAAAIKAGEDAKARILEEKLAASQLKQAELKAEVAKEIAVETAKVAEDAAKIAEEVKAGGEAKPAVAKPATVK